MNNDQRAKQGVRQHEAGGQHNEGMHDRLDTIEDADNRTERLDPERASVTSDPIQDMLDADESNADYKDEADRVTPTIGPPDQTDNT